MVLGLNLCWHIGYPEVFLGLPQIFPVHSGAAPRLSSDHFIPSIFQRSVY
jgi:hypothetical protein